jgi:hypothetical protein
MKNQRISSKIIITGFDGRIFIACTTIEVYCDVIFLDCDPLNFEDRVIYNANNHVLLDYVIRLRQNFFFEILQ